LFVIAGRRLFRRLTSRGMGYWAMAVVILVAATWAKPFIDGKLDLESERSWLFQRFGQTASNPAAAGNARLVLIRDDEYWTGPLHHRAPIDRAYLAALVRALDRADAAVIAIDFDLRAPVPQQPLRPGDYALVDDYPPYRAETDTLAKAIDEVAERRKIILAKTIAGPLNGPFSLQSDVYQPYGLCDHLVGDGVWSNPGTPEYPLEGDAARNISCGYIALMDDPRQVPPPARIGGSRWRLDAFSAAIARARGVTLPAGAGPSYATYIEGDLENDPRITVSARDLLADPDRKRAVLAGWPVIIGAAWSQRGFASGPLVDLHRTPIGLVGGALIHDNLAEALLRGRTFPGLSDGQLAFFELAIGAVAAILFALVETLWTRIVLVLLAMGVLLFFQWAILGLFGFFFDAFAPVLAMGLHAIGDRLVGSHRGPVD